MLSLAIPQLAPIHLLTLQLTLQLNLHLILHLTLHLTLHLGQHLGMHLGLYQPLNLAGILTLYSIPVYI